MTSWRWLVFEDNADGSYITSFAVHQWSYRAVMADLRSRHPDDKIKKDEPSDELFLDTPGMVITTRPIETFNLLGLRLRIPCEDVGQFANALLNAMTDPKQDQHWRLLDTAVPYLRLKGFHRAIILTRGQVRMLWKMLDERSATAAVRSDAHWAAWSAQVEADNAKRVVGEKS